MPLSKDAAIQALRPFLPPNALQRASICEGYVGLRIALDPATPVPDLDHLAARAFAALRATGERVDALIVEYVDSAGTVFHTARPPQPADAPPQATAPPQTAGHQPLTGIGVNPASRPAAPQPQASPLPGVRHAVAVGAGKGGVGKSTIALNLAVGLARRGHAVGLMDGDIYGPSMPTLLGLASYEPHVLRGMLQPFFTHGIKAMTIGKLVDADKPLIWRGPMAHGAFKQLVEQTDWGELDYLIIDLPPGTGDVPLTMAQLLQLTGAVIVCTPQRVAQDDAVRATRMFQQLGVDILGVVENMSYFLADDLSPPRHYDLFGRGGAQTMAQRLGVPFLGAVPLTVALRANSDAGNPTANFAPNTPLAHALEDLITQFENQVALASMKQGRSKPTLTVS
jgi:ATP-binding protein involved in chromosome partitioning